MCQEEKVNVRSCHCQLCKNVFPVFPTKWERKNADEWSKCVILIDESS